jgi:hypothetical protein
MMGFCDTAQTGQGRHFVCGEGTSNDERVWWGRQRFEMRGICATSWEGDAGGATYPTDSTL